MTITQLITILSQFDGGSKVQLVFDGFNNTLEDNQIAYIPKGKAPNEWWSCTCPDNSFEHSFIRMLSDNTVARYCQFELLIIEGEEQ